MGRLSPPSPSVARYINVPRIPSPDHLVSPARLRRTPILLAALLVSATIVLLCLKNLHFYHFSSPDVYSDYVDLSIPSKTQQDATHRVFRHNVPPPTSPSPRPIAAYSAMSDQCAETWISLGIWDADDSCASPKTELAPTKYFDAVWAWVNGSDPVQVAVRSLYAPMHGVMDARHRYSDHGELRYSIRSFVQSAGPFIRKLHIMASAFPAVSHQLESPDSSPSILHVGQRPAWLTQNDHERISVHHDVDYFSPIESSDEDFQSFRKLSLPSFNSMAVESQMHNLPEPSTDQLVYLNDDFFHLRPHTFADYFSPLYGPVLRSLNNIMSMYTPVANSWRSRMGETPGIQRAAWVLSNRFTYRRRPYVTHHARSISLPLLHEAVSMFPHDFGNTTLARFRADEDAPPGVQSVFLGTWFVPERHREALLWSYIVARWGSTPRRASDDPNDPTIGQAPIHRMWNHLANALSGQDEPIEVDHLPSAIDIHLPVRNTLPDELLWNGADMEPPKGTEYTFTSADGYSLSYLSQLFAWDRPLDGWPDLSSNSKSRRPYLCTLRRQECFAPSLADKSIDEVFKYIAFENSDCGDCLIQALVHASGEKGLDEFLPRSVSTHTSMTQPGDNDEQENLRHTILNEKVAVDAEPRRSTENSQGNGYPTVKASAYASFTDIPPHLPLTSTWEDADFSLENVMRPFGIAKTDLRTFCVRLIQRYSYALGTTPSQLVMMKYVDKVEKDLDAIDNDANLSMLALNDDIIENEEIINDMLQVWFKKRWPNKLEWEI